MPRILFPSYEAALDGALTIRMLPDPPPARFPLPAGHRQQLQPLPRGSRRRLFSGHTARPPAPGRHHGRRVQHPNRSRVLFLSVHHLRHTDPTGPSCRSPVPCHVSISVRSYVLLILKHLPASPHPAFAPTGSLDAVSFRFRVVAAVGGFDPDGPAPRQSPGNLRSGFTQYAADRGSGDSHPQGGVLLAQPFRIDQTQGLHSFGGKKNLLQACQRNALRLVESCQWPVTNTAMFSGTRHGCSYYEIMLIIKHPSVLSRGGPKICPAAFHTDNKPKV